MATWKKELSLRENGELVSMQVPEIISASRSTDIPAFYADWFFHRLRIGYSAWSNPFNGTRSYISYQNTRFIVFWSKNPRPLLKHLDELDQRGIGCYIQYTLNDYEKEGLEKGVRPLEERIDTFKRMVDRLGKGHVIWRFDPLILTDDIRSEDLLEKINRIGDRLQGYTDKLVFSYADIAVYKRVKQNLEDNHIPYREWTTDGMVSFAEELAKLNHQWGYELATCGEKVDLDQFGIRHNRCIDDELIIKLAHHDKKLMDFLGVSIKPCPEQSLFGTTESLPKGAVLLPGNLYALRERTKDNGQRAFCGCIQSKDIGEYNTCPHLCEYCYANSDKSRACANFKRHQQNLFNETITGI